jgi:hypothetical protein
VNVRDHDVHGMTLEIRERILGGVDGLGSVFAPPHAVAYERREVHVLIDDEN